MTSEKKQMIDWLRAKGACQDGREWAERECNSLAEVWSKAKPEWLIWVACRALKTRKRVAFGAACAERVRHLLTDQRSKDALDVAHRYGRGEATDSELSAARDAAGDAAWDAAVDAARAAAWAAALAAAWDAAWDAAVDAARAAALAAAWDAAWDAAVDAARAAAWAAARAAAWDAAREWQAAHLRENFHPDWSL